MAARAYVSFLILTAGWLVAAVLLDGGAERAAIGVALIRWGLVVMLIATGYYLIQEAPAARVTPWLRRDLVLNLILFLILLFAMLDALNGFRRLGVDAAGWIAFAAAAVHPLAVDRPHRRHHESDPAGSPVPQYVPPACLWIDWTLAVLLLAGNIRL